MRMLAGMAVLVMAALVTSGCTHPTAESSTSGVMASGSATPIEVCRPGAFDPAAYPGTVSAGYANDRGLTDDTVAYTMGLLPKNLLESAELRIEVREPGTDLPVALAGDFLVVRPDSGIAPAEVAAGIVSIATLVVLSNHMALDTSDATDVDFVRSAAMTTALDTYIKLAALHPESTQGKHYPKGDIVENARLRLAGTYDGDRDDIDVEGSQQSALFLGELSNFFGHAYYRQRLRYVYKTAVPLPDDEASRLLRSLAEHCG